MGDELATVMDLFHSIKKTGRSPILTMSTKGMATIVKLEFKIDDAKPKPSSPSTVTASTASSPSGFQAAASGVRHRHQRSAARRAKANARAALHRGFQALPFLQCCAGSYCPSTSTTTSTSSLSKGGEPPSHVDCEQEGWLPAHLLPAGRGWRSTSQAHF